MFIAASCITSHTVFWVKTAFKTWIKLKRVQIFLKHLQPITLLLALLTLNETSLSTSYMQATHSLFNFENMYFCTSTPLRVLYSKLSLVHPMHGSKAALFPNMFTYSAVIESVSTLLALVSVSSSYLFIHLPFILSILTTPHLLTLHLQPSLPSSSSSSAHIWRLLYSQHMYAYTLLLG